MSEEEEWEEEGGRTQYDYASVGELDTPGPEVCIFFTNLWDYILCNMGSFILYLCMMRYFVCVFLSVVFWTFSGKHGEGSGYISEPSVFLISSDVILHHVTSYHIM